MDCESKIEELIKEANSCNDLHTYIKTIKNIVEIFPLGLLVQLEQLVDKGPVSDENILSKKDRDKLLELKLATYICFKRIPSYTVANKICYSILEEIKQSKKNKDFYIPA